REWGRQPVSAADAPTISPACAFASGVTALAELPASCAVEQVYDRERRRRFLPLPLGRGIRAGIVMKTTVTALLTLVRIIGVMMIVLGVLFWTGNAAALIPIHMLLGVTLVLLLWTLAVIGAVARVNVGLVAVALVWGLIVPVLGVTQTRLLPG